MSSLFCSHNKINDKKVNDKIIYEDDGERRMTLEKKLEINCPDCPAIESSKHYCPFEEAKQRSNRQVDISTETQSASFCFICKRDYKTDNGLFGHYRYAHSATKYVKLRETATTHKIANITFITAYSSMIFEKWQLLKCRHQ